MKKNITSLFRYGIALFGILLIALTPISSIAQMGEPIKDNVGRNLVLYTYKDSRIFPNGNVLFKYLPEQVRAEIFMSNPTRRPLNFKDAKYYLICDDDSRYRLEFETVDYNDGVRHSTILNPQHTILIFCTCPVMLDYNKIRDMYIDLWYGQRFHFVRYETLEQYLTSPMRKWEVQIYEFKEWLIQAVNYLKGEIKKQFK